MTNINDKDYQLNKNQFNKNKVELSSEDRQSFQDEFKYINALIEQSLENDDVSETSDINSEAKPTTETTSSPVDPLAFQHSYNDKARAHAKRLNDLNIIKDDRTGKNFKASGNDV
ncbi:MAG: hypothetical protein VW397_00715 [Candidatus Margulisiibacteriota bacterium]